MVFVKGKQLSEITGLSPTTFKRYRLSGVWQQGIHWQRVNSRLTLYNRELVLDWLANRLDPASHQRTIEIYLHSLPSNQPLKRGRRAGK